ncbi:MAG: hypothetical protein KatS3mg068_2682 [Candidatus Sericytochromatia bacterium]|nr:MAG: hypothetical protein KatS3mg068_2682 [Candidatus Sericytochromatia bacterium]
MNNGVNPCNEMREIGMNVPWYCSKELILQDLRKMKLLRGLNQLYNSNPY